MRTRRSKPPVSKTIKYTKSSGNVFADLGLPDADELLEKAEAAVKIARKHGRGADHSNDGNPKIARRPRG